MCSNLCNQEHNFNFEIIHFNNKNWFLNDTIHNTIFEINFDFCAFQKSFPNYVTQKISKNKIRSITQPRETKCKEKSERGVGTEREEWANARRRNTWKTNIRIKRNLVFYLILWDVMEVMAGKKRNVLGSLSKNSLVWPSFKLLLNTFLFDDESSILLKIFQNSSNSS